jgi:hypothetical protein
VTVIKKNDMGRVCGMYGGRRGAYKVSVGRPDGKRLLEDPGINRRILRWIFKKWMWRHGLDCSGSG